MAVAGAALIDIRLGVSTWIAAAAQEVPQELSALTFPLRGVVTWMVAQTLDVTFLVLFTAGNFLYIGASDLVPEVNKHRGTHAGHFASFGEGLLLMMLIHLLD
ncbi:MAG: hypothetical protein R2762_25580 [Bryobacteraceae bacterium]